MPHDGLSASNRALLAQLPIVPTHIPRIQEHHGHQHQSELEQRVRRLKAGLYHDHVPKIPPPNESAAHNALAFMHKHGAAPPRSPYGFLQSKWKHVPKPREAFANHRHHPNYDFMVRTGQKYSTLHRALQLHYQLQRPVGAHASYRHDAITKQLLDAVHLHDRHHYKARQRWADHQRYFTIPSNRGFYR